MTPVQLQGAGKRTFASVGAIRMVVLLAEVSRRTSGEPQKTFCQESQGSSGSGFSKGTTAGLLRELLETSRLARGQCDVVFSSKLPSSVVDAVCTRGLMVDAVEECVAEVLSSWFGGVKQESRVGLFDEEVATGRFQSFPRVVPVFRRACDIDERGTAPIRFEQSMSNGPPTWRRPRVVWLAEGFNKTTVVD